MDENTTTVTSAELAENKTTKEASQNVNNHKSNHDRGTADVVYKNPGRSSCAQVVATLIQIWLLVDVGMEIGISALVIGALHKNTAEKLCMDDSQASWYASLPFFGRPIGSLASGFLQEYFGRQKSMLLINIPLFAAWLILYFANSVHAFYVSALIMGLSCGLCEAPTHSYIGEIAEPRLRGTLSILSTCGNVMGVFVMFVLGYLINWRMAALIGCVVPVITFICVTQIPESPTWLITKNRLEDAQKSLSWLRGWIRPEDVQDEFEALVKYVNTNKQSTPELNNTAPVNENGRPFVEKILGCLKTELKEVTSKRVLRPLYMVLTVFVINYATGLIGLRPYLIGILNEYGSPLESRLILIFSPLIFLVGAMSNVTVLRRFGKRKIALFSQGIQTCSILLLGVYCTFFNRSNRIPSLVWIPIGLTLITDFFNGFSITPLPWQLVCEIFPPSGRGTASGISGAWAYFVTFAMSKSFLYLQAWINFNGVMYFYGVISILGLLHHYYYLPETEGKTLAQIESYFTENHDRKEKFSMNKTV